MFSTCICCGKNLDLAYSRNIYKIKFEPYTIQCNSIIEYDQSLIKTYLICIDCAKTIISGNNERIDI